MQETKTPIAFISNLVILRQNMDYTMKNLAKKIKGESFVALNKYFRTDKSSDS